MFEEGNFQKKNYIMYYYSFDIQYRLSRPEKGRPTKLTNGNQLNPFPPEQPCIHAGDIKKQPLTLER